jgi:predicted phage baseplate assembly protein
MTGLPTIDLDDRTFQDLVNEARIRIQQTCPEWTEHNVSDPGITLIELFAWMTELTIYRLNRIPEKLHLALLDLLDIELEPAIPAQTGVCFRLSGPATQAVEIPAATEVGVPRVAGDEPIVFQTDEAFTIPPLRPVAYLLSRDRQPPKPVAVADGVAKPHATERLAFGSPPRPDDALYLGFDASIGRLLLSVDVEASQARGVGIDPHDPPLCWEVFVGDDRWESAELLLDGTGGFNYGNGAVELQLPATSAKHRLGGQLLHWLRCRIVDSGKPEAKYTEAPEIYSITAAPIGALLPSSYCVRVGAEVLGTSDGTPGQEFPLRTRPVLELNEGETLEVQNPGESTWTAWKYVSSFAASGKDDRHFSIDLVPGEIEFGPAIRQPDGHWQQYGAIPKPGAVLRMSGYRHGGGSSGNVAAHRLTSLKSSIAGVATADNPRAARDGVDAESLIAARQRAAMEIRARSRAVTAEDYEFFACEASQGIARARCRPPSNGGPIELYLLPRVQPADRRLEADELEPEDALFREVRDELDKVRTIGTTVRLLAPKLRCVSVVVHLQATATANVSRVEADVLHALYTFINPLVGGSPRGPGDGWTFGRPLNQGELFSVVHGVEGVEHIKVLRVYETNFRTGQRQSQPAGSHVELDPDELLVSGTHIVKANRADA